MPRILPLFSKQLHNLFQHFQHTYIHTCKHASMQACKHAFIHTYMHACVHAYMHACMHSYTHTYMLACMHAYIHTYIHPCMHACMHAFIHTYIHACMHACIHTYMHAYIHTYMHWFAIMVPHISTAYRECSYIFSTSRIGFHQVFFFRSLSHQLSSLCHCFSLFMFIHFHVVVTCYPFGIVFTWPLFWYMLSSMLIICNCFIFRFHHISYIYIYIYIVAPPQVFCFKEIRKIPQEDHQTCKIPISILTLQMPFCIKNLNECRK